METLSSYRLCFDQWRDAIEEYELAVGALLELSQERGQGDRTLPLVVSSSDEQLLSAVQRELDARAAVDSARRRLAAIRLTQNG
jgi:hypothetical protein